MLNDCVHLKIISHQILIISHYRNLLTLTLYWCRRDIWFFNIQRVRVTRPHLSCTSTESSMTSGKASLRCFAILRFGYKFFGLPLLILRPPFSKCWGRISLTYLTFSAAAGGISTGDRVKWFEGENAFSSFLSGRVRFGANLFVRPVSQQVAYSVPCKRKTWTLITGYNTELLIIIDTLYSYFVTFS